LYILDEPITPRTSDFVNVFLGGSLFYFVYLDEPLIKHFRSRDSLHYAHLRMVMRSPFAGDALDPPFGAVPNKAGWVEPPPLMPCTEQLVST
jgi:hypothetical protein